MKTDIFLQPVKIFKSDNNSTKLKSLDGLVNILQTQGFGNKPCGPRESKALRAKLSILVKDNIEKNFKEIEKQHENDQKLFQKKIVR